MPSGAGFQLLAGRIPGERIATTSRTADVTPITTEQIVDSVTAALVNTRVYKVRWTGHAYSTVKDGRVMIRIREDNLVGASRQQGIIYTSVLEANQEGPLDVEFEYTAAASANKTFVATAQQVTGTGTVHVYATSFAPTYLYVDYIRG